MSQFLGKKLTLQQHLRGWWGVLFGWITVKVIQKSNSARTGVGGGTSTNEPLTPENSLISNKGNKVIFPFLFKVRT